MTFFSINQLTTSWCTGDLFCVYSELNKSIWLSERECSYELSSLYDDKAPSITTVYRRYSRFNPGDSLVAIEIKFVVPLNIDALRTENARLSCEIEPSLHISSTTTLSCKKYVLVGYPIMYQSLTENVRVKWWKWFKSSMVVF